MVKFDLLVALVSNSNVQTHATYGEHNHVVKLATPVNLPGQTLNDVSRWEVALATLQYTNHFCQLREDVTIYAVVTMWVNYAS
jgi:hypothetical protein